MVCFQFNFFAIRGQNNEYKIGGARANARSTKRASETVGGRRRAIDEGGPRPPTTYQANGRSTVERRPEHRENPSTTKQKKITNYTRKIHQNSTKTLENAQKNNQNPSEKNENPQMTTKIENRKSLEIPRKPMITTQIPPKPRKLTERP